MALSNMFVLVEPRFDLDLGAVVDTAEAGSGRAGMAALRRQPTDGARTEPQGQPTRTGELANKPAAGEVDLNDPHAAPP
jgi:hypothetical protein